jgi:hypothetical protein
LRTSSLESRYRWLLGAYPADHRHRHGEEMLGVLMTAARPDQRHPGLAETADLVRGALLVRLRRSVAHYHRRDWKDALALVSVLAPLILLALATDYGAGIFLHIVAPDIVGVPGDGSWRSWLQEYYTAPIWGACAMTAVAVLLGARRTGAVLAFGVSALMITSPIWSSYSWSGISMIVVLLGLLSGVALLLRDGPRRARELMGLPALLCAVTLAVGDPTIPQLMSALPGMYLPVLEAAPIFVTLIVTPVWLLRTAPGRRACALLLIAFSPLASFGVFYTDNPLDKAVVSLIELPALALVLLAVARSLMRRAGAVVVRRRHDRAELP